MHSAMADINSPSPASSLPFLSPRVLLLFGLLPAIIAATLVLLTAPAPRPPMNRAEGSLLVQRLSPGVFGPQAGREGNLVEEQFQPHPQAVARLLRTAEVAETARQLYEQRTGNPAPSIPTLLGSFEAATDILADTAVRREVSPVITVSLTLPQPEQAVGLLQCWMEAAVSVVGQLITSEVNHRVAQLEKTMTQLNTNLDQALTTQSRTRSQMALLESQWIALHGHSFSDSSVSHSPGVVTGLLPSLLHRQLGLPPNAATAPFTDNTLDAEEQTLALAIEEAQSSSTILTRQLVQLSRELALAESVITDLKARRDGLREPLIRLQAYAIAASGNREFSHPSSAELRIVSPPIMAQPRSTPRSRFEWAALFAAAAGAFGLFIGVGFRTRPQPYQD